MSIHAFGGGYKNGGMSDEAMNLIADIFRFDYMGAAEFEFGIVPQTLQTLAIHANKENLVAWSFDINLADVAPDFRDKTKAKGVGTIYVLSPQGWQDEVEARICQLAEERYNHKLKEDTRLATTLRPFGEWDGEVVGWLELDNGFMFFTDYEMWGRTCGLFGVDHLNGVS